MSHEIEVNADGTAAAAFANGQDPWHRLGHVAEAGQFLTFDDVMDKAHLGGWNVRPVPMKTAASTIEIAPPSEEKPEGVYALDDSAAGLVVPGVYTVVRDNPFTGKPEVIGSVTNDDEVEGLGATVGNWWKPIQNEDMAIFLQSLVEESGSAGFDTAASLNNGRDVFITLELPKQWQIGGQDAHGVKIAFLNNHTGTRRARVLWTTIRIVCANTQRMAEMSSTEKTRALITHTGDLDAKIADVRKHLDMVYTGMDRFAATGERLMNEPLRKTDRTKFVKAMATGTDPIWQSIVKGAEKDATERQKEAATRMQTTVDFLFDQDPTISAYAGTKWAAFNAVTRYLDHVQGATGEDDEAKAIKRAQRVLGVSGTTPNYVNGIKDKAWKLLVGAGK
jgi:phage/plasmid-like protein (TIGR03299 family)